MKSFIQFWIQWLAKKIVQKYHPTIVAVTGSVGKTSTRQAIATVLGTRFHVRTAAKNYNNEFGVPLTIIGEDSPGRSLFGWLRVLWRAKWLWLKTDASYPNLLVLEYGVDHPGDMAKLCAIARPDVAVLTALSHVHVENFGTFEKLTAEKAVLLEKVKPEGLAVLNADDEHVRALGSRAAAPVRTYGMTAPADVRAADVRLETRQDFSFEPGEPFSELHFRIVSSQGEEPVALLNLLGAGQVSAALAAATVGLHLGVPLHEIVARFSELSGEPGRLRPLPGIKGSLILDDTYNAAPASVKAALDVLRQFSPAESARRIAVLGKMAELGTYSEAMHREIGAKAVGIADLLITVGEEPRDIRRGALEAGLAEEKTQHFEMPELAGRWLDREIKKGDIVLVKGSQSARMEKVVKDIMAEPSRAAELLVRQYGKWLEE